MTGRDDHQDQREARGLALGLVLLVVVLGIGLVFLLPSLSDFVQMHLEPGVGLKDAAIAAFFIALIVMIVFAIFAGDGLIGEIQFMIAGFLSFFFVLWIMIAWVF
jgi:hypothetical protein